MGSVIHKSSLFFPPSCLCRTNLASDYKTLLFNSKNARPKISNKILPREILLQMSYAEGGGGRRVTLAGWTIFFHVNTSSRPPEMREVNRKYVRRPYVKETTVQFCLYFFQCAHAFLCILRSAEKLVPSQCYLGHQNFLIGLVFQK